MKYKNLKTWAKRLVVLSTLIALVTTVYAFGATTPQDAIASGHVEYVPLDWSLKPAGIDPGERFRLIFLTSTKRNATSSNIETYNTFVQNQAAAGHANIQDHSSRFKVVGCTQAVDARDNTGTTSVGIPIYWVGGNKVADNYADFYDGSWDDEANDRNELGNDAHDTSQTGNYTWTGCSHDGTKSFSGQSLALGKNAVQWGRLNASSNGPIEGTGSTLKDSTRPFYALSPVFQVPSLNASTLSPTGAPYPGKITSNTDNGIQHRVKLLKNGQYRIDVKGSETHPARRDHRQPPGKDIRWQEQAEAPEQIVRRRIPDHLRNPGHRWRRRRKLPPGYKTQGDKHLRPAHPPSRRRQRHLHRHCDQPQLAGRTEGAGHHRKR